MKLLLLCALLAFAPDLRAARLDVLDVPGVKLRGNPLADPTARRLAVFAPDGAKDDAQMPLVIYLPGW